MSASEHSDSESEYSCSESESEPEAPITDARTLDLMVRLTWVALTIPVYKHSLFDQVFPDKDALSELCGAADLSLSPGVSEAIHAATPPPISFFRGLPSDGRHVWGVNVLVLKKSGAPPALYIGCGTEATRGVVSRFQGYDGKDACTMPKQVIKAFAEGYKIVHKGLLLTAPLPSAANVPRYRLLSVSMEAALSFLFWSMHSRKPDHFMISLCPRPLSSLSYDGLCSHSPLREGPLGNFDLSAEQLEAIATVAAERARVRFNAYLSNYRKVERALHPEKVKERKRKQHAKKMANFPDKHRTKIAKYCKTVLASEEFFCDLRGIPCRAKYDFERHMNSDRHQRNVAQAKAGVVKNFKCTLCGYYAKANHLLLRHNGSKKHQKKIAEALAIGASASS
ncbi:hypothetical protein EJ08DRAFT_84066 [Tothia fuscella]|uniref:Uncharacterized protein n=1 Tax=Tothia fuscella TaxID=1048955 RepID=A0A9P4NED9_9PEZI|nr:hypothetical protein EJ08DRAFT_84066 [Tothia fuscella]